jgi:NAD(P) transhydrogenase
MKVIGSIDSQAAVQAMYGKTNKSVEIRKALVPPDEINDSELVFESSSDASDIEGFLSFGKLDPLSLENNPFAFPVGIWSSPEAAYYGLSSQQAHDMGVDAGEGIALYSECLRGLVFSPNGLLKLIFNKTNGRIIGVHICGDDACELIHYGMELVRAQRTVYDVIDNLFSAVTYHEMYRIAALAAIDPNGARKRRAAAGAALAARNRPKRDNTVK